VSNIRLQMDSIGLDGLDLVRQAREYRDAIVSWAKDYARRAPRTESPERTRAAAEADLRRWSGAYFCWRAEGREDCAATSETETAAPLERVSCR
jgi:hypothetical protein